jgi:threonine dehydratase
MPEGLADKERSATTLERTEQERTEQERTEQERTEQEPTEQERTEQEPTEQEPTALERYADAAARIAPYVRRTPLLTTRTGGREVSFKLEHLQVAGVFKIRGALNALLARRDAMTSGQADARVVTASGGNHGLGVATAARWLGIPATVYVPATVPDIKAARIAAAGADVVKTGRVYADAERAARAFAAAQGLYYLHAYDDPAVVAGQGTLALEIVADLPECDVIAVPVGGGGLLAGVSGALAAIDRAAKTRTDQPGGDQPGAGRPGGDHVGGDHVGGGQAGGGQAGGGQPGGGQPGRDQAGGDHARGPEPRRVVGVEPEGCPTLHAAVEAGAPVDVGADSVAASALGAARIGNLAFAAYRSNPVGLVLVSDKEIVAARDRLWEEFRLAVEPAAATVFAAWLAGQVPGAHPCLVLSGANAAWIPA